LLKPFCSGAFSLTLRLYSLTIANPRLRDFPQSYALSTAVLRTLPARSTSICNEHNENDHVKHKIYFEFCWLLMSISATGFLAGCAANPPPLPPNNPADPQVRGPSRAPRNLLARDETTLAIERQLSAGAAYAESAEKMEPKMGNMPGMQHGEMQHQGMQQQMQPKRAVYTCPMHPQIHSDEPGNCPICGMKLVPKKEGEHEGH
jgi:hypothetical protein